MKPIHGQREEKRPADAVDFPSIECGFKKGDRVVYTNDYGAKFDCTITGFSPVLTSWGAFIYMLKDSWWFPVCPESLKVVKE